MVSFPIQCSRSGRRKDPGSINLNLTAASASLIPCAHSLVLQLAAGCAGVAAPSLAFLGRRTWRRILPVLLLSVYNHASVSVCIISCPSHLHVAPPAALHISLSCHASCLPACRHLSKKKKKNNQYPPSCLSPCSCLPYAHTCVWNSGSGGRSLHTGGGGCLLLHCICMHILGGCFLLLQCEQASSASLKKKNTYLPSLCVCRLSAPGRTCRAPFFLSLSPLSHLSMCLLETF